MAIQINGNGTITGINVGGLPDGIVDTDMIAASAVTPAKSTITGGKILQAVTNTSNTQKSTTAGSSAVADIIDVSITPSNANNKILVLASVSLICDDNGNAYSITRLYRGSSSSGTQLVTQNGGSGHNVTVYSQTGLSYLDSPSTTSATTYTLAMKRGSSSTNVLTTDGTNYMITAMEVAA